MVIADLDLTEVFAYALAFLLLVAILGAFIHKLGSRL